MRSAISFVVAAAVVACGPAVAPQADAPPPVGRSYKDYLRSRIPKRPADTRETDKMTLHVIDIGQGTALLLEFPCGAMLIDTGGEQNDSFDAVPVLRSYLAEFFARRTDLNRTLDALVITHPHIDHTRGIDMVLRGFKVKNVVTNGQQIEDIGGPEQTRLHTWVERTNTDATDEIVGVAYVDAATIPETGRTNEVIDPVGACEASAVDPIITALWGSVSDIPNYSANPNEHSVALRIEFGKSSILMTGDLEIDGLHYMAERFKAHPELLDVDVYVVGHHGSKNATAPHQMQAMSPKIAVISAGPYERSYDWTARKFGHPNTVAIKELTNSRYGVGWPRDPRTVWVGVKGAWEDKPEAFEKEVINRAVYSTGWDGTIKVRLYDNDWLEVETERPAD